MDATQFHFSPEVLYVTAEDAVAKFLQRLILWLEKKPSTKTSHSNKVPGALTDMEDPITTMLTPREENTTIGQPESHEASNRKTITPSCPSRVSPANDAALSVSVCSDDDRDDCKGI